MDCFRKDNKALGYKTSRLSSGVSCGKMVDSPLNCLRTMTMHHRLPDHIDAGVRILFVGINPGLRSARIGHHFAGFSNRFWKLLYASELVTEPLTYQEDWRLPEWKLGLTNIISRCSAGIDVLDPVEYRRGKARLEHKLARYQPRIVAMLGITMIRILFPDEHPLELGMTRVQLAGIPVFLLPNPSGRNAHYSYERMLATFRQLRQVVGEPLSANRPRGASRRSRTAFSAAPAPGPFDDRDGTMIVQSGYDLNPCSS